MVLSKYRILLHMVLIMFGVYDSEFTMSDVLLLLCSMALPRGAMIRSAVS